MSTARDWLKDSLLLIGAIASGESIPAEDAKDGLRVLNRMLDGWNTQNLAVYGKTIEEFSLVAGQNSYTLGSGGNFNTARPVKTDAAFFKFSDGTEIPVRIIDNKRWGSIPDKSSESTVVSEIYIDNNFSLSKVYVYPTPSEVNTLILHNWRKLSSIASLNTEMTFPEGYEEAIVYNWAIRLAPLYGKATPAEVATVASTALSNIKRANIKPEEVGVDPALLGSRGYNILTGGAE